MLDPIIISYKLTIYLCVTYLEYKQYPVNTSYNKYLSINFNYNQESLNLHEGSFIHDITQRGVGGDYYFVTQAHKSP